MKFAVYGTLKRGFGNNRLLEKATFLGEDVTSPEYTMYSLGGFPGVVPKGNTSIKIEVYETSDENIIQRVNSLEGFTGQKGHVSNWYDTVTIPTAYGEAEMFIFHEPPRGPVVEDGNWKR